MKPEAKTLVITHGNNSSPFIRFQDGKSDRYIQIANLHLGHLGVCAERPAVGGHLQTSAVLVG